MIGNSLGNLSKETRSARAPRMLLDESQRLEGHLVEMGLEGKKKTGLTEKDIYRRLRRYERKQRRSFGIERKRSFIVSLMEGDFLLLKSKLHSFVKCILVSRMR